MRLFALLALLLAVTPAAAQQVDVTPNGRQVVVPHSWYGTFSATGDLDSTTDVSIITPRAGRRHCVTGVTVSTLATLGSDQVVRLLSNDTVIWQCALDAAATRGCDADLMIPVCTVAGEALEIDVSGNPTDDLVYYNVQGFTTPTP